MEVKYASHCSYRIRYHMVFVVKYRKELLSDSVFQFLKCVFNGISQRYYLDFHAIGHESEHLHILVAARPRYSPSNIMQICKSLTAKQIFKEFPEIREELWNGYFWTEGGHIDTVGDGYGEEEMKKYIHNQGRDKNQLKLLKFT